MSVQQDTPNEPEQDELSQVLSGIIARNTPEDALGIVVDAVERSLAQLPGENRLTDENCARFAAALTPLED